MNYTDKDVQAIVDTQVELKTKDLKQALNEIKKVINECKMLMPHEFDWEEQADNILQIIDKVLGGSDERGNTKLKS